MKNNNPQRAALDATLHGAATRAFSHARWAYEDHGTVYTRRMEHHERECREIADYIIAARAVAGY